MDIFSFPRHFLRLRCPICFQSLFCLCPICFQSFLLMSDLFPVSFFRLKSYLSSVSFLVMSLSGLFCAFVLSVFIFLFSPSISRRVNFCGVPFDLVSFVLSVSFLSQLSQSFSLCHIHFLFSRQFHLSYCFVLFSYCSICFQPVSFPSRILIPIHFSSLLLWSHSLPCPTGNKILSFLLR